MQNKGIKKSESDVKVLHKELFKPNIKCLDVKNTYFYPKFGEGILQYKNTREQ